MIRKKKFYVKPKKAFEAGRIKEENLLIKKYGLKNKREIWKASARINYLRSRAKALAKSSHAEQNVLFKKLQDIGFNVSYIADVLGLKVENWLDRRLATVVAKKGIASTPRQARQMITHRKILVRGETINVPGYIVRVDEENKISLKQKQPKQKTESKEEQKGEEKNG